MLKVIIFCFSGIGNTIFFTPALKSLKKGSPEAKITLLVTKSAFAEPVRGSGFVDEIIIFNDHRSLLNKVRLLFQLRQENFDYSITAFPSNRWQFNLLSFLIEAKKRITHSYSPGHWKTLSFLQNIKIPADRTLHDVDQNLNLLRPLKIELPKEKKQWFYLSKKDKQKAQDFWNKNYLNNQFVIGIHPGSGGILQDEKRWPLKNFIELGNMLIKKRKATILVFGGPEEKKLKEDVKNSTKYKRSVYVINTPLKLTAALIKKCDLFISNDSGLMNIAVAVKGPKVIGIFGPTNYVRTSPYGRNCYIVRKDFPCSPCLKYPFFSTSSEIECHNNFRCFKIITVEDVFEVIKKVQGEK